MQTRARVRHFRPRIINTSYIKDHAPGRLLRNSKRVQRRAVDLLRWHPRRMQSDLFSPLLALRDATHSKKKKKKC